MNISTGAFESEIKSLSPEILLQIFLCLDSHEAVILRSVCRGFLEVIDNNKSLWRILDWIQQEEESPIPALEMFDEKSASTLREVSIFQGKGELDNERFVEVLRRSKGSLVALSLNVCDPEAFRHEVLKLASSAPLLNSLIIWSPSSYWASFLPRTRLTRISSTNQSNKLQILWCLGAVEEWEGKLDVSSLVSSADPFDQDPLQLRSIISKFSRSIIHLSIAIHQPDMPTSLSCPNLSVLEGEFPLDFPSWLDAPNLQIVIASVVGKTFVKGVPVSVQELWLLSLNWPSLPAKFWDFLPLVCPKLKLMRLGRDYFKSNSDSEKLLAALRSRQDEAQERVRIKGIEMMSLEKLILPIELLQPAEVDQLRGLVGAVIDIEDYPDFIELEY